MAALQQQWSRKSLIVGGSSVFANAHLFSFCRTFYLGVCYLHQTTLAAGRRFVCPSNSANRHCGRPWLARRASPSPGAAAASNFLHLPHIKAAGAGGDRPARQQGAYLRVPLRVVRCCCCCWCWWWRIARLPVLITPCRDVATACRWDFPTTAVAICRDPMFN